ncbi:50S ribosomal protein L31 [Balneola sp. MJW-20]|uniref:50S ribosomal protein L31 n=1 Tax=Gracilimonas aurantiaca TaxID=3234185 RepID=UPI003466C2DB
MKKGIHPDYKEITVILSDGTEMKTRSTLDVKDGVFKSEVDSKNHPFYTKKNTLSTKDGRIDRFKRRYGKN